MRDEEISIHAPHTGRDGCGLEWGAQLEYFNPRAPYGARQAIPVDRKKFEQISIHAPHTGRDSVSGLMYTDSGTFQSTRPIRGATIPHYPQRHNKHNISIHAPHTGRDSIIYSGLSTRRNFNPRAPYGARRYGRLVNHQRQSISIHAPHTGRDAGALLFGLVCYPFQSTRPIRGATKSQKDRRQIADNFNPRAPYGARQQKCIIYVLHFCNNRQLKHKNQQETSSVRTFF